MAMKKKDLPAVVEIEGVHGYIDKKGVAWLNVEDAARGLGFVEVKPNRVATSGDKYSAIRWTRINGYLAEYDYPPVKAGDFIPENIFYLLAMKANNEAAKAFQLKIANEVLPSIRKTGFYGVQKVTSEIETLEKIFGRETSNFLKARELKEMAAVTKNQILREGLIRQATTLLTGKDIAEIEKDPSKNFIENFIDKFCVRIPKGSITRHDFLEKLRIECSEETAKLTDNALTSATGKINGINYGHDQLGNRSFKGIKWKLDLQA